MPDIANPQQPTYLQQGGLVIAINPDFRTETMARIQDLADYSTLSPEQTQKYLDAAQKLCDIEHRIVTGYPEFNIFDYLPLTKSGDFPAGQSILLADAGLKHAVSTNPGEYFGSRKLQLRLVPTYANVDDFIHDKKCKNVLIFKVDGFTSTSKTPPVFDKNGNASKPVKPRSKYLSDDEIEPGVIYTEANGSDYLYLGNLIIDSVIFIDGEPDECELSEFGFNINSIEDIAEDMHNDDPAYCYVRMSKKYYAMADKCKSLGEFIQSLITARQTGYSAWTDKLSVREKHRKFTSLKQLLFEDKNIPSDWIDSPIVDDSYHKYRVISV